MKVIVKQSGWYGGNYYDAGNREQDIPDIVAAQFLPPYGDQLEILRSRAVQKQGDATNEKQTNNKVTDKAV